MNNCTLLFRIPILLFFLLMSFAGKAESLSLTAGDNNCPLTISVTSTPASAPGVSDGTATAIVSGGVAPYSYQWCNGYTAIVAQYLLPGQCCVTVTDNTGCSTVACVIIQSCSIVTQVIVNNQAPCSNLPGSATALATGGIAPYSYLWDNGEASQTATALSPGTHTVTVTDAIGCTASASVIIYQPSGVNMSVSTTATTASAMVNGGTAPYTFLWSNGEITSTIINLPPGTYCCTVTDNNGCEASSCATIQNCSLVITATADYHPECFGVNNGSASVFATGGTFPYIYQWDSGQNGVVATGLSPGIHTVTVTDAAGCIAIASVTIFQPAQMNMSISTTVNSASVIVTGGNPPYTFLWNNGQTPPIITNLPPGTYCCTVTDSNGCEISSCTSVQNCSLVATAVLNNNPSCFGMSDGGATAFATGGTAPYSYFWDTGQNDPSVTNLDAGIHTVTVTDVTGCTATASVMVAQPYQLGAFVSTTPVSSPGANDGTATVTGSGGTTPYSYLWSNGVTIATTVGLTQGTYCVTVLDANWCEFSTCVTIQGCSLAATVFLDYNVSCFGLSNGAATTVATGGVGPYTYQWDSGHFGPSAINLDAGIHIVTVADATGCTVTASVTITEPPLLSILITSTQTSATAIGSGGVLPIIYQWSNGANTSTINNLTPGTYCCTITDVNNCQVSSCTTIQGCTLALSLSTTNASCNGACDGSISAVATGGTPPYTYSPAQTTNLCAGTYVVVVTDAVGCTASAATLILEPPPINIQITTTPISTPGANDGTATATAAGGTPAYSYQWSNGAITPTITNLSPGTYCVTVTDTNGCQETACVTIQGCTLVATLNPTPTSCNGLCDGSIGIMVSGGTPPYTYSPTQTNNLCAGTYLFTVTDAAGCMITASTTIVEPPPITVVIFTTPISAPGANDGSATASGGGGTPGYTYLWSNGSTQPTINNLGPGTYCVTVTDSNGCEQPACTTIQGCSLSVVLSPNHVSCFGDCDGAIMVTAAGGTPPYTYSGNTNNLCPGTYTIVVTDSNGCVASASSSITEPQEIMVTLTTTPVSTPGGSDGTGTATVTSGGIPPYQFIWYNGEYYVGGTSSTATALPAGNGCVTVVDGNGCAVQACGTVGGGSTSTSEIKDLKEIRVYPNPTTDIVNLEAHFTNPVNLEIQLYNSLGQAIRRSKSVKNKNKISDQLDISYLPPGIYLLELRVGNQFHVQKIIKH